MLDAGIKELCRSARVGVEKDVYGAEGYWDKARMIVVGPDPEFSSKLKTNHL